LPFRSSCPFRCLRRSLRNDGRCGLCIVVERELCCLCFCSSNICDNGLVLCERRIDDYVRWVGSLEWSIQAILRENRIDLREGVVARRHEIDCDTMPITAHSFSECGDPCCRTDRIATTMLRIARRCFVPRCDRLAIVVAECSVEIILNPCCVELPKH